MRLQVEQVPFAVFPAKHPDVGDIELYDDGDELTVVLGHFTHRHFGSYDEGISDIERAGLIAKECVDFLREIFADQVVFFGSHAGGGGSGRRGEPRSFISQRLFGRKTFVWSGPLEPEPPADI